MELGEMREFDGNGMVCALVLWSSALGLHDFIVYCKLHLNAVDSNDIRKYKRILFRKQGLNVK